jgi:uncharacterized damage-inducible protein DinB
MPGRIQTGLNAKRHGRFGALRRRSQLGIRNKKATRQERSMSRTIVDCQRRNIDFVFSLAAKFIEVCPEEIWTKKFGGWSVAQQLHHALAAVDLFVRAPQEKELENSFPEAGDLASVAEKIPSREQAARFHAAAKAAADRYTDALSDDVLADRHEGASLRMGRDVTHANILVLLAGHLFYHLGACDAALREHGMQGVF